MQMAVRVARVLRTEQFVLFIKGLTINAEIR